MRTMLRSKVTLLFVVCTVALLAVAGPAMALGTDSSGTTSLSPTIQSDQADYPPGASVTLTGSNWQPGESVRIVVNDTYGATWKHDVTVTADANGDVTDTFSLSPNFVSDYDVTATGAQSGTATTTFTDSNPQTLTVGPQSPDPVTQGSSATYTVSVGEAGNTNDCTTTLSASGLPSGASASFTNNPRTGSGNYTSTLTVSTTNATPAASTSFTVTMTRGTNCQGSGNLTAQGALAVKSAQQAQTITFNQPAAKTYGDADFDPGATASSGLPVSYNSDTPSVCTIVSGKVHIVSAGDCTVTASQAGNANYTAAPSVQRTIVINKANQTITFTAPSGKTFGDANFDPGATASSGLAVSYSSSTPSVCTIVSGEVHIVSAGTCTVTASQGGNTNYNAAPSVERSFSIAKANQTITGFDPITNKVVGATFPVSATASSGLPVGFAASGSCTVTGNNVSVTGVGTCTITASQAGNTNYNAAPNVTQSFNANYTFTGFASPVDNNNVLNSAKAGQAIPLKWRLTDASGNPVTNLSSVKVTATSLNCSLGTTTDLLEEYAAGASGLQNLGDGYYQFNWKSPTTYANSCKTLNVDMGEGAAVTHTALFKFTK